MARAKSGWCIIAAAAVACVLVFWLSRPEELAVESEQRVPTNDTEPNDAIETSGENSMDAVPRDASPTSFAVLSDASGERAASVSAMIDLLFSSTFSINLSPDDSRTALRLVDSFARETPRATRIYSTPGAIDLLREELRPDTALLLAEEARDQASLTLLSVVLAEKLRESAKLDPVGHRDWSVAASLAVELINARTDFTPGNRVSFATTALPAAYADASDTWVALLERVADRVPAPREPDASYAFQYRILMPEYAQRGQAEQFDMAAARWLETDWPQNSAHREWRVTRIARLRAEAR